ncbi:MAG: class I SAM-dependent methyltransferase [Verrucomicrobiales bacterium]|nr:class I SAM-dependent methyltransferase [Verrucomicrobiales bacterium]
MPISIHNRLCDICQSSTHLVHLPHYSLDEWEMVECLNCQYTFLANPPPYQELETTFAWEKTSQQSTSQRHSSTPIQAVVAQSSKKLRRSLFKRRKIRDLAIAHMPEQPGTIVDIGCMKGDTLIRFCKELRENHFNPTPIGIEISTELAQRADKKLKKIGGRCIHADALSALSSIAPSCSGLVIMSAYLEHEYQALAVLKQVSRVLKSDGIAVIKVPNFASWNRHIMGKRWCGFRYPDHVNYFTPKTLMKLCSQADLQSVRFSWRDRFPTSDNMYAVVAKAP